MNQRRTSGFSPEGLQRLSDAFARDIAARLIPGAVIMLWRHGETAYLEAMGVRDPGTGTAMTLDTIFRIYSMTKPITSVALMMLAEEGRVRLDEPVATYIPSFGDVRVGIERDGRLEHVMPLVPMTIHDLMRHTSGITYGFFGESLVKRSYLIDGVTEGDYDTAEFAERIARQPLAYQPGTVWDYSHSTDVLGRIVEIASGVSLGTFFKRRIFEPLGMVDTAFYLTDSARIERLAEPFADDRVIGTGVQISDPRAPHRFEGGGGGLVSTVSDYARFVQMLLDRGIAGRTRFLGPRTLAFMTADHVGPRSGAVPGPMYLPGPGFGFGLGFGVRVEAGGPPYPGSVGEFNWGGVAGTYFWVDPREDMYAITLIAAPKYRQRYRGLVKNLVYAAMVE